MHKSLKNTSYARTQILIISSGCLAQVTHDLIGEESRTKHFQINDSTEV